MRTPERDALMRAELYDQRPAAVTSDDGPLFSRALAAMVGVAAVLALLTALITMVWLAVAS